MNIEIANRLVQYRKVRGMSQEELAAELGLSRQAVSKWERAEASPDTDNLIALARLYGVSLDTLLLAQEPPAVQVQTGILESEPPAAPYIAAEELPQDEIPDDLPNYSSQYTTAPANRELSPGAQAVIKIVILAVCVIAFFIYGVLSWIFPGLKGAYPLVCTASYLIAGFIFNNWHPSWLVFLTIPIYYTIFG